MLIYQSSHNCETNIKRISLQFFLNPILHDVNCRALKRGKRKLKKKLNTAQQGN